MRPGRKGKTDDGETIPHRARSASMRGRLPVASPATLFAKSDIPIPPDLLNGTYPGVQGILELQGDHVHNCGNLLLHITNFGLIGSQPGRNTTYSGAPSAQWPKAAPPNTCGRRVCGSVP
jgi:hypothetical protein